MNTPVDPQLAAVAPPIVAPTPPVDAAMLQEALKAMNSLLAMFSIERYIHLLTALASSLLLFYATWKMITGGESSSYLGLVFGASGLATVSASRSVYFFKRAFDIVEKIVLKIAGIGQ